MSQFKMDTSCRIDKNVIIEGRGQNFAFKYIVNGLM